MALARSAYFRGDLTYCSLRLRCTTQTILIVATLLWVAPRGRLSQKVATLLGDVALPPALMWTRGTPLLPEVLNLNEITLPEVSKTEQ